MANHQPEHLGEEFKDEKTKKPLLEGAERLETELEDDMVFETELEADMATLIMNWLVSSVINTLAWMVYVSSVFSQEATTICSPFQDESYSGWVPTQVSLNMLICRHRSLWQMYFAVLMIFVLTYLITHRSSLTKKRKLVTYHVLFLGIVCGLLVNLCVNTLGDIGQLWLFLWAVFCLSKHVLDVFTLALVGLLYSPINVTRGIKSVPYWARGSLSFLATLLVLPLIMSQTTFATFGEWINQLSWWYRF